ncbi:unnamed protein product [Cylicocyclus nassatus]|uniref:CX domain-containing protein n=1 Tax=Cylicocyclus nassatus TaxID=53992 RepID=A0AA36GLY0_CYLNA|nr:unnamed protein product [Cylicocyclus nassatus]
MFVLIKSKISGGTGWGRRFGYGGYNRGFGFRRGYGLGSMSSGHSFRNALIGGALGAFGGMLMYDAGRYLINSMGRPFHYGNRNYYWDDYRDDLSNKIVCSVTVDELIKLPKDDQRRRRQVTNGSVVETTTPNSSDILAKVQYKNGTKPKTIVWACESHEVCCGIECCPAEGTKGISFVKNIGWIIFFVALGLLVCCCLIWSIYACNRPPQGMPVPRQQYPAPEYEADAPYDVAPYGNAPYDAPPYGSAYPAYPGYGYSQYVPAYVQQPYNMPPAPSPGYYSEPPVPPGYPTSPYYQPSDYAAQENPPIPRSRPSYSAEGVESRQRVKHKRSAEKRSHESKQKRHQESSVQKEASVSREQKIGTREVKDKDSKEGQD